MSDQDLPRSGRSVMSSNANAADGIPGAFAAPLRELLASFEEAKTWLPSAALTPVERRALPVWRPHRDEDPLNAFIHRFDLKPVRDGPLSGQSVAVKDTIAIAGVPRTRGSRANWDTPAYDAPVIRRLLENGATITGTLNMDAWSASATGEGSEFGMTVNPRRSGHLPGGSSCGAGAAVVAGVVDLAVGTDTAGSARIPAGWCGAVALKPTHGAIPVEGVVGLDPTLDCVCPLARDVVGCMILFSVLAARPVERSDSPLHIGIVDGTTEGCDSATLEALARAEATLAAAGYSVQTVSIPLWRRAWEIESILLAVSVPYLVRTSWQGRWSSGPVFPPVPGSLGDAPQLIRLWSLALEVLGHDANELYARACGARAQLSAQMSDAFGSLDLLMTPTTPTTAPLHAPVTAENLLATPSGAATAVVTSTLTTPANLTGIPAMAVPFGASSAGLPCSVQLHAPHGREDTIFAAARVLEASD